MKSLGSMAALFLAGLLLVTSFPNGARSQTLTCVQPAAGLVSWWPFDEASGNTANDIVGGKTGALTGTTVAAGKVSNARRFVPGDAMAADGSGVLDITGTQVTVETWFKLENNPTTAQTFTATTGKTTFPDKQAYLIAFESGPIAGGAFGTLPQNQWQFEYVLTNTAAVRVHNQQTGVVVTVDGLYHHFALTYDGGSARLYVDGTLRGTYPFSGNLLSAPAEPIRIFGGAPFSIDELGIYHRTLSQAEVQAIFAAGSAGRCKLVAVAIDIKPEAFPNAVPDTDPLNLSSQGGTPVAIFSTPTFDASTVEVVSVLFAAAPPVKSSLKDVDGDSDLDMVLHFDTQALDLTCSSTDAMLTGQAGGAPIEGTDTVRVLKDKNGVKCP
jgi:hypothetical protein